LTCLVAALALLAGCSDSGDRASGDPGPTASGTPTESTSTSTSTPDVEPASGKLVETSYFTVRVPRGFKVDVTAEDFSIYASNTGGETEIALGLAPTNGNDFSLDQLAHQTMRSQPWSTTPRIAPETTVAGEPAYHLTGPVGNGTRTETYGVGYRDMGIVIVIDSYLTPAKLQDLADSVLATWQWT
jgi:hypothetical protein